MVLKHSASLQKGIILSKVITPIWFLDIYAFLTNSSERWSERQFYNFSRFYFKVVSFARFDCIKPPLEEVEANCYQNFEVPEYKMMHRFAWNFDLWSENFYKYVYYFENYYKSSFLLLKFC